MSIIADIGINKTIFFQLGLFLLTYFSLEYFVFKPYFKAFEKRDSNTTSSEDIFAEHESKIKELELNYETQAKSMNEKVKDLYNKSHKKVLREKTEIIEQSQNEVKMYLESQRKELRKKVEQVKSELEIQVSDVADTISTKILS